MSQIISQPNDCCNECPTPAVVNIPGENGAAGAAGASGANGISAFTQVANYNPAAQPVMPAEGGTVTVNTTSSTAFLAVGEPVFVENWGILKVTAIPTASSVTLQNLENTASNLYPDNVAPGTSLPAGSKITGSGFNGANGTASAGSAPNTASYWTRVAEAGLTSESALGLLATGLVKSTTVTGIPSIAVDGTDYLSPATGLKKSNNLSDVANVGTSRTNLGLGTAAVKDTGNADTKIPLVNDAAGLTNGEVVFATATGIESVDAATAKSRLGIADGGAAMLIYAQQQISGVGSGSFSGGAGFWIKCPLNTEIIDTGNNGTIAANQITLLAGTYRYRYKLMGSVMNSFTGRLYNATAAAVIAGSYGSPAFPATGANAICHWAGRFTIGVNSAIELQGVADGPGTFGTLFCALVNPAGAGVPNEQYSSIELEKE